MANRVFSTAAGAVTTWTLWGVNSLTLGNIFSLDAFDKISVKDEEGKDVEYERGIMATYASGETVDPKRLSAAVEKAMLPIKTLFAVTVVTYGGSYILSSYAPIVAPFFFLMNKVLIWVGAEFLISIYHMRNLDNFFEQRSVEKKGVDWSDFIAHVNRCTHSILSSTILISLTPELRKDLLNLEGFLTEIRDNEGAGEEKKSWQQIAKDHLPGIAAVLSLGPQVLSRAAQANTEGGSEGELE